MALPTFKFSEQANFQPFEGGLVCDLLPFDGAVEMEIHRAEAKTAKGDDSKAYLELSGVIADDAEYQGTNFKGSRLVARPFYAGVDKNGEPLGRQFTEFLHARGLGLEQIHANAAQGAEYTPEQMEKGFNEANPKKKVYVAIGSEEYQGQRRTVVTGYLTKERYETLKSTGAHRRPAQVRQRAAAAGGGGTNVNLGGVNSTAKAAAGNVPHM